MTDSGATAARARCLLVVVLGIVLVTAAGPVAASEVLPLTVSCGLPHPDRNLARGTFEGRPALRFVLGRDDTGRCKADIARGGYNRAELRSDRLPRGRVLRVSFDVFLPKNFPATGGIAIGQFHQIGGKPLVLLMASRDAYRATPGTGLKRLGAEVTRRADLFDGDGYGRWHRIVMEARFMRGDGGFIRVRADGRLRFEAQGATVATEPYFKIGLYGRRARMAGRLTVYVTPPVLTLE